jgi:hypothetical protein
MKNLLFKDKIPELPPQRLRRKSKEVIEERKIYLTRKCKLFISNLYRIHDKFGQID